MARQCGMEVAGLSCVTNRAAGPGERSVHDEVLAVGRQVASEARLLMTAFARIYAENEATREGTPGDGGAGGA